MKNLNLFSLNLILLILVHLQQPCESGFFFRSQELTTTQTLPTTVASTTKQSLDLEANQLSNEISSSKSNHALNEVQVNHLLNQNVELRLLASGSTIPILLLPLLLTPFVPVTFVPALFAISTSSIFFYEFGNINQVHHIIDFVHSLVTLESNKLNKNLTDPFNKFNMNTMNSYMKYFTSLKGLNQIRERILKYFGAEDKICQQRMVCEAAYTVSTKLPIGYAHLLHTFTNLFFNRINNNLFFNSWVTGLANNNCTLLYQNCVQSPFKRLLNI